MLQIMSTSSPKPAPSSSATSSHWDHQPAKTGRRSNKARAASLDLADLLHFSRFGAHAHPRDPSASTSASTSASVRAAAGATTIRGAQTTPREQEKFQGQLHLGNGQRSAAHQQPDPDPQPQPRYRHTIAFESGPQEAQRKICEGPRDEERRSGPGFPSAYGTWGKDDEDQSESDVTTIQIQSRHQSSSGSDPVLALPLTSSPSLLSANLHPSDLAGHHSNPSSSSLSTSSCTPEMDNRGRLHVHRHFMAERSSSELSFTCRGLEDEESEPAPLGAVENSEGAGAAEEAYKELDGAARPDPRALQRSDHGSYRFSDSFDLFPSTTKSSTPITPSSLLVRRGMTSASFKTIKGSAAARVGAIPDPLGSAYRAKSLQQMQKRWMMNGAYTGRVHAQSEDEDSEEDDEDDDANSDSSFSATQDDEDRTYGYERGTPSGLVATQLFGEMLSHKLNVALEERKLVPTGTMTVDSDIATSMVRQVSTESSGNGSQRHRSPKSPCSIVSPLSRKSSMASSRKGSQPATEPTASQKEKIRSAAATANTLDDWSNAFTSIVDLQSPRPAPLPPVHVPLLPSRERSRSRQRSERSTPGAMAPPSLVSSDSRNTSRMHSPKTPMTASMHATPSLPASRADSRAAVAASPELSAKAGTAADDGAPLPTSGLLARRSFQHTRSSSADIYGKDMESDQVSSGLGLSFGDRPTKTVRQRGHTMGGEPLSGLGRGKRSSHNLYEHIRPPAPSLSPIPPTPYTPSTTAAATWRDPSLPNSYFPAQASNVHEVSAHSPPRSKVTEANRSASARTALSQANERKSSQGACTGKRLAAVGSPCLSSAKLPSLESRSAADAAVGQQLKRGLQSLALDVRFGLLRTKKKLSV